MLNFDEEIKRFKPSLEIEQIESQMKNDPMTDLLAIVKQMTIDTKHTKNKVKE